MHFLLEWQPDLAEVVKEIPRVAEASRLDLDEISKKVNDRDAPPPQSGGRLTKMSCDRRAQRRHADSERDCSATLSYGVLTDITFTVSVSRAHEAWHFRIFVVTFVFAFFAPLFSSLFFFFLIFILFPSFSFCIFRVLTLTNCFLLDVNTTCDVDMAGTGDMKARWHFCLMSPDTLGACSSSDWTRVRSACKW